MKRIYAVTMAKNESDIIESFCRHTLNFCDGILICDDSSADGTKEILQELADEGLPVICFDNLNSIGYHQDLIINHLAKTAADTYGADLILPFDADEFLCCANGGNPRDMLECLSDSEVCALDWPFFLPTDTPRENGVFLPSYFNEYISQPRIKKIIVGAALLQNPNNKISIGNQVLYKSGGHDYWDARVLEGFFLAHYPVRSAEQIITKAVAGWANALCTPKPGNVANNWGEMYRRIKRDGPPGIERLREFAMTYTYGAKDSLPLLSFRFQSDITLRYTDYEKGQRNFLNIILENYERIITRLMKREADYSPAESVRLCSL